MADKGGVKFSTAKGEWTVSIASTKNIIMFERHFNVSPQVLEKAPRLEYIAFMAWSAAKDQGIPVAGDFDGFIDELIDLETVEGDGTTDENPTAGGS